MSLFYFITIITIVIVTFTFVFTGRVTSGQVCRPHFHSPLHPWISTEAKPPMVPHPAHHTGPSWCSPFPSEPSSHHSNSSGMNVHHSSSASSHSSPHLFGFPPTPPKDATPDNLSSGYSQSSTGLGSISSSSVNGNEFSCRSNSITSSGLACSSSDPSSLDAKSHYVGASHHNMITTWGSSLANSSSTNKPREGSAHFSSSLNQSLHHPASINPYHPHYAQSNSGPPASAAELSGSGSYGFSHHSPSTSSMFHSSKSFHNSHSSASNKSRTKGRSSAGKRLPNSQIK